MKKQLMALGFIFLFAGFSSLSQAKDTKSDDICSLMNFCTTHGSTKICRTFKKFHPAQNLKNCVADDSQKTTEVTTTPMTSTATMATATATSSTVSTSSSATNSSAGGTSKFQIGIDFVGYYGASSTEVQSVSHGAQNTSNPLSQPTTIMPDLKSLGLQYQRQISGADLLWNNYVTGGWAVDLADVVIKDPDVVPIVILFSYQYASGTPPTATSSSEFQKTLGSEAKDYISAVLGHYNSGSEKYIQYVELGNEMDHWQALENGDDADGLPASLPESFTPQEQGVFLKQTADYVRSIDPSIAIVMPGMSAVQDYALDTWLPGVVETAGADVFDVVNYHCYSTWQICEAQLVDLKNKMAELGIAKPIWLTETGSSSDPSNNSHTRNNSPEGQAGDIFKRTLTAYALGVEAVSFFSYYDNPEDDPTHSTFFGFGIRTTTGEAKLSYYALKLFISELIPFASVTDISPTSTSRMFKTITNAGTTKYVVWGSGNITVPAGMSEMTSVIPSASGAFEWKSTAPGQSITIGDAPILLK